MRYSEIIIKPLMSEKTVKIQEEQNIFTFEVASKASKTMVKEAVKKLFKVKVEYVNIIKVNPKAKKTGQYAGFKKAYKKAYVKLAAGEMIGSKKTALEKKPLLKNKSSKL